MNRCFAYLLMVCSMAAFAGCANEVSGPKSAPPSTDIGCAIDKEGSCKTVVGAVFAQPMSLNEVVALAKSLEGEPVALWRTDAVCVVDPGPPGGGPSENRSQSHFSYWRADELVHQQSTKAPPATTGGWTQAVWSSYIEQWKLAEKPGVMFSGAALDVPDAAALKDAEIARGVPIRACPTRGARVLFLEGGDEALNPLFDFVSAPC